MVLWGQTDAGGNQIRSLSQWTCSPYSHSVAQISYRSVSSLTSSFPITLNNKAFKGDLGVQRGVCRWYLSLHSDEHPITVSPEKKTPAKHKSVKKGKKATVDEEEEEVEAEDSGSNTTAADGSGKPGETVTNMPPPFTPSVTKILKTKPLSRPPPDLPDGLPVTALKSRLSGKKIKRVSILSTSQSISSYHWDRGALLTPSEMEQLTETWKPYRSLGASHLASLVLYWPSSG